MSHPPFYTSSFAIDFRYLPPGHLSDPDEDADAFAPLTNLIQHFEEEAHPLSGALYTKFAGDFLALVSTVPQYTYPDPLFERVFVLFVEYNPVPSASNAFLRNYSSLTRTSVLNDTNTWLTTTKTELAAVDKQLLAVSQHLETGTLSVAKGAELEREFEQQRIELLREQRWVKDVIAYLRESAATVKASDYYRSDLAITADLRGPSVTGASQGAQPVVARDASPSPAPVPGAYSSLASLAELNIGPPAPSASSSTSVVKRKREPSPIHSTGATVADGALPSGSGFRSGTISMRTPSVPQLKRVKFEPPVRTGLGPIRAPTPEPPKKSVSVAPSHTEPIFDFPDSCDQCRQRGAVCIPLETDARCMICAEKRTRCTYWLINRCGLIKDIDRRTFAAFNGKGFAFPSHLSPTERLHVETIVEVLERREDLIQFSIVSGRTDALLKQLKGFAPSALNAATVYSTTKEERDLYHVDLPSLVARAVFVLNRGQPNEPIDVDASPLPVSAAPSHPAPCTPDAKEDVVQNSHNGPRSPSRSFDNALVYAIDELTDNPMPSGYTTTHAPAAPRRYASALDNDIVAIREEYNVVSARVRRDTSHLRTLEKREEKRTKMFFGNYETPFAPAPQRYWEVRELKR